MKKPLTAEQIAKYIAKVKALTNSAEDKVRLDKAEAVAKEYKCFELLEAVTDKRKERTTTEFWLEPKAIKNGEAGGVNLCFRVAGENGRPETVRVFLWNEKFLRLMEVTGPAMAAQHRKDIASGTLVPSKVWNGKPKGNGGEFVDGGKVKYTLKDPNAPKREYKVKGTTVQPAPVSKDDADLPF